MKSYAMVLLGVLALSATAHADFSMGLGLSIGNNNVLSPIPNFFGGPMTGPMPGYFSGSGGFYQGGAGGLINGTNGPLANSAGFGGGFGYGSGGYFPGPYVIQEPLDPIAQDVRERNKFPPLGVMATPIPEYNFFMDRRVYAPQYHNHPQPIQITPPSPIPGPVPSPILLPGGGGFVNPGVTPPTPVSSPPIIPGGGQTAPVPTIVPDTPVFAGGIGTVNPGVPSPVTTFPGGNGFANPSVF